MRILRHKRLGDPIELPLDVAQPSPHGRKRELCALVQSALKVGSDLAAREAGRRAFAELMKLDRDLQPAPAIPIGAQGQVMFTSAPKRRRLREAV